jgi:integrase
MSKKLLEFESGHPDLKPAPSAGFILKRLAHFGADDHNVINGFEGEISNQIKTEMIKSVSIKDFNGDIAKRWYIEYREFNPLDKSWSRKREYGGVNREKDPSKRYDLINALNKEVLTSLGNRIVVVNSKSEISIKQYIDSYLDDKKETLRSVKNYKLSLTYFYNYLVSINLQQIQMKEINRSIIHEFRKQLSRKTGSRSVFNHINCLKGFFNYYKDNYDDIILANPVDGIDNPSADSESHVAYTFAQQAAIFEYLKEANPKLLLYIQFVGMGFIRCKELRFLKVGDIDFINRTITITAKRGKTKKRKIKPMMNVFFNTVIATGIQNYPSHFYVFTLTDTPGPDMVHENYFQKKFQPVKKEFKLSVKHTLYGFRHTFVCRLLRNGAKWHEVMKYTGHTTMEAFSKYARSLMDEPAEDLSKYLK